MLEGEKLIASVIGLAKFWLTLLSRATDKQDGR